MVMKAALSVSILVCGLSSADALRLGVQDCDHLLSKQQATTLFRFPTKEDTTKVLQIKIQRPICSLYHMLLLTLWKLSIAPVAAVNSDHQKI